MKKTGLAILHNDEWFNSYVNLVHSLTHNLQEVASSFNEDLSEEELINCACYFLELMEILTKVMDSISFMQKFYPNQEIWEFLKGVKIYYLKTCHELQHSIPTKHSTKWLNDKIKEATLAAQISRIDNKQPTNWELNLQAHYEEILNHRLKYKELYSHLDQNSISQELKFTNNFDTISSETVYAHFKLCLLDSRLLTKAKFHQYIKAAFEQDILLDTKIVLLKEIPKSKLINHFAHFYQTINGSPKGKQEKYIKLLTNYFEGFEFDKVKNNFRTNGKTQVNHNLNT